jgi:hypothetical protein
MGYSSNLDTTPDAGLGSWVFSAMTANATAAGGFPANTANVLNIGNVPTDFSVFASVYTVSAAPTDYTVVSVMGSTTSDFSSGNYVLGHIVFGDGTLIGTTFGAAPSADRGPGHYTVRCHNVATTGLESTEAVVCPYIRLAAKTVGATSSLNGVFTISIGR